MTDIASLPKFCPNCGTASSGNRFCGNCGADMATSTPAPAPSSSIATASRSAQIEWAGAVVLVAGALAGLGAFLPWITATAAFVGTITRNGLDGGGDGIVTMVLGLLIALFGIAILARSGSAKLARVGALIAGAVLIWIAIQDINSVNDRIRDLANGAFGSLGMGLIVTVLAGVLAIVGSGVPATRKIEP